MSEKALALHNQIGGVVALIEALQSLRKVPISKDTPKPHARRETFSHYINGLCYIGAL